MSEKVSNWLEEGLFAVGGWHPLAARIRRSVNQPEDIEAQYEWEFSEERVKLLASQGVNLIMGAFDRGLGDTDASDDHERARYLAELCHQYGLKHGCYLANTIYYESMLKDHPDCEDWAVRNFQGRFAHYGGEQTFRLIACFNNPGWTERMKRIIRKAVERVNTDVLHFDNLAVWPEPDGCHCEHCQKEFRAFLYRRYPAAAEQRFRFGFGGFETFRIPNFYENFQPAWSFSSFANPLIQDYIDFRCETVTGYIRKLSEYARSLNRAILLDSNGQSISGVNRALLHGADSRDQLKYVDFFCDECSDFRKDPESDAVKSSTIGFRGMKLSRQTGKALFCAFRDEESLAFNLAFGGSPGIYMGWGYAESSHLEKIPLPEEIRELLNHFLSNRGLYGTQRAAGRVAVLRSRKSLRYISTSTHLSVCVMEQLLFNSRIPFTVIDDDDLNAEGLERIDLLILPDVEYLSEEQEKAAENFVVSGKSLLLTEFTGRFKANGRVRGRRAFDALFHWDEKNVGTETENAVFDPSAQHSSKSVCPDSSAVFVRCGSGLAAYIPKIYYRHPPETFQSRYNVHYNGIDSRYWKVPHNATELLDAMQRLMPDLYPVTVSGADHLFLDLTELRDKTRACMLFRAGKEISPQELLFSVRSSRRPLNGRLHRPGERAEELQWTRKDGRFETELKGVRRLAVVTYALNWQTTEKRNDENE